MIFFLIILELVLFWPSVYVLNKWLKQKNLSNSDLTASFLILLTFAIVDIGYYQFEERYLIPKIRSAQFDSQIWKSEESERFTMVNSILENNLFIGKTRTELINILGTDYELGPCKNCIGYSTFDPDIGFSIDHNVLVVYFDSKNHVIEIRSEMW
jgi:hypothetical protein